MNKKPHEQCIIIMGPTASGKTALAVELAKNLKNAALINADSMQVYDHCRILTARPSEDEKKAWRFPYFLDGVVKDNEKISSKWWESKTVSIIKECFSNDLIPIVVGGTGFYLKTLIEGLSPIPEIPKDIRLKTQELMQTFSLEEMQKILLTYDKDSPMYKDPQRLQRALEVIMTTQKPLREFQKNKVPLLMCDFIKVGLFPSRENLYQTINQRFLTMMMNGALNEAKMLLSLKATLNDNHPIFKATGVRTLWSYLLEKISLDEAIENAQRETRQYAKRQLTWMKSQMKFDYLFDPFEESLSFMVKEILKRIT